MKAYIILVYPNYGFCKASSEAYKTLADAQQFVENRSDIKFKLNDYEYIGSDTFYTISEIHIE